MKPIATILLAVTDTTVFSSSVARAFDVLRREILPAIAVFLLMVSTGMSPIAGSSSRTGVD
jgi:hypothetical protein